MNFKHFFDSIYFNQIRNRLISINDVVANEIYYIVYCHPINKVLAVKVRVKLI